MGRWIMEQVARKIPHKDGLVVLWKVLDLRADKIVSTDSLIELAAYVVKNAYLSIALFSTNNYGGVSLEQKWLHLMQ